MVLLLAACSTATQRAFVAPTEETVVSTTEMRSGDPPEHLIFIENRSTVPITVFSVALTRCENVKQQCSARPVSMPIGPGQRRIALRVEPDSRERGFSYRFGFGWRADSAGMSALSALAAGGDQQAQSRLAATQRADSIARAEGVSAYKELTREDFAALAGRAARLLARPDSLVIPPGERTTLDRVQLLVADSQGTVFGRTRWARWLVPGAGAVRFVPPDQIIAQAPGRVIVRFRLADDAEAVLGRSVPELRFPIVVAYPPDPHAPTFGGIVVDADSKTPLPCARVALEDSAQNVVARGRTANDGSFTLGAPRPGSYRVRVEAFGWWPAHGPPELGLPDEVKRNQYSVRFVDQMIMRRRGEGPEDFEHAYPAAVSTAPVPTRGGAGPLVGGVTLGGSESMPVLGIISRTAPPGTTWTQFVVDSLGRIDTTSVILPPETSKAAIASVRAVLPRVRFSPAREAGRPTCEMLRMQVNFTPR